MSNAKELWLFNAFRVKRSYIFWSIVFLFLGLVQSPKLYANDRLQKIQKTFENWPSLVPKEMRSLPPGVQRWYVFETVYLSRTVDTTLFKSPESNKQDVQYAPESRKVFDLVGFWIPENQFDTFKTKMPEYVKDQIFRLSNGQKEFLFFVHPESYDHYPELIHGNYKKEIFKAAATSSSRSLLVWKKGYESRPFIAKVSLMKEIGGLLRSILVSETSYSIAVTDMLQKSTNLPEDATFMEEVFSAAPKGVDEGGMIIRTFPEDMLTDKNVTYLPLFALYGGSKNKAGWLVQQILNSGLSTDEYLVQKIIRPFLKLWLDLELNNHTTIEPHAQNMLMKMVHDTLIPHFGLRDHGGFNINDKERIKNSLYFPSGAKNFGDLPTGNFALAHEKSLVYSLNHYFKGGFIFNLEKAIEAWESEGLLPYKKRQQGWLQALYIDEIERILPGKLWGNFANLPALVYEKHLSIKACQRLFK